jgi:hypothetical protein
MGSLRQNGMILGVVKAGSNFRARNHPSRVHPFSSRALFPRSRVNRMEGVRISLRKHDWFPKCRFALPASVARP